MLQSATSSASLSPSEIRSACGPGEESRLLVIVLTYNEEANLPHCLASLEGLNCQVWVIDSGSTDRTVEIAHDHGAQVSTHPFENYAAQRNWALDNVPLQTSWLLNLDADERLTPELVSEMNHVLRHAPSDLGGFMLRKRTVFMGRWIRYGGHYPSYHLRLFRAGMGRCEDRQYDQHFLAEGRIERLNNDYIDVIGSNISSWSIRHVKWAAMEAGELIEERGERRQVTPDLFGNPIQQRRWLRNNYSAWPLFARAFLYWVYRYFLRLGFLDGIQGLIFHFLQGFWFRFLVDAMIWERSCAISKDRG